MGGKDIRNYHLTKRKEILESLYKKIKVNNAPVLLSQVMFFDNWNKVIEERKKADEKSSEGLMIKKKDSIYSIGRKKGFWFKWKSDQNKIDAVLTYAMEDMVDELTFIQIILLLSGKMKN